MFKDLEVGHKIQMSIPVKRVGTRNSNCGATYAPHIQIKNLENDKTVKKSFNQLPKRLEHFEFEEVYDKIKKDNIKTAFEIVKRMCPLTLQYEEDARYNWPNRWKQLKELLLED